MKTASAKAKGRRLQKEVAKAILDAFGLHEDDVKPAVMGESGEDIKLSKAARDAFPFSVECKNTERLHLWGSIAQAEANAGEHMPLLVFRKNGEPPRCVIRFDDLLNILKGGR